MPKIIQLLCFCAFLNIVANAQLPTPLTPDSSIRLLKSQNQLVVDSPCGTTKNNKMNGRGMIVTNKALNIFFADKIGSYLSESGDLSLFNNYATLSSTDGKFSLNHNFKHTAPDNRITALTTIGAKLNFADGFATIFDGKKFTNEIGINFKQTWLTRGSVYFDNCSQKPKASAAGLLPQKTRMNRIRAALLVKYADQIREKGRIAKSIRDSIEQRFLPNDSTIDAGPALRDTEYVAIYHDYDKQFASDQAKQLSDRDNSLYNLVTANWVSLSAYIPVTTTTYKVAPDYLSQFNDQSIYPFQMNLSFNRIWESFNYGRFFVNINSAVLLNSSVNTDALTKTSLADYKNLGGVDTMHLAQIKNDDAYVGHYTTFVTPSLSAQLVYFPKAWNVGISIQAEQNFGIYNPLNTKVGIPIRLNDKDGNPTVNFELQWRLKDLTDKISTGKSIGEKSAIGISVGLPFSSFLY